MSFRKVHALFACATWASELPGPSQNLWNSMAQCRVRCPGCRRPALAQGVSALFFFLETSNRKIHQGKGKRDAAFLILRWSQAQSGPTVCWCLSICVCARARRSASSHSLLSSVLLAAPSYKQNLHRKNRSSIGGCVQGSTLKISFFADDAILPFVCASHTTLKPITIT